MTLCRSFLFIVTLLCAPMWIVCYALCGCITPTEQWNLMYKKRFGNSRKRWQRRRHCVRHKQLRLSIRVIPFFPPTRHSNVLSDEMPTVTEGNWNALFFVLLSLYTYLGAMGLFCFILCTFKLSMRSSNKRRAMCVCVCVCGEHK